MAERLVNFTWYLWKATRGRMAFGTLLLLAAGLAEGFSLILLVPIISVATPGGAEQMRSIPLLGNWLAGMSPNLPLMLILLLAAVVLQAGLLRAKSVYNARIFQIAIDRTRLAMFRKLGMARWEAFSGTRLSDLNYVLTGETDRILGAANSFQVLLQAVILLVIYAILAFLVSWQMTLFTLATGAVLFAALYPVRRRAASLGRELTRIHEQRSATILEFLTGMRIAKTFTVEAAYADQFRRHLVDLRENSLGYVRVSSAGTFVFQVGSAIVSVGFVWLAIETLHLDLPRIAFLVVIFLRLVPRFLVLQQYIQQFLTSLPAFESFCATIEKFVAQAEPQPQPGASTPRLRQSITFRQVEKHYEGAKAPSLQAGDVSIRAGCITAVIGSSGSGKSTMADLLLGLTVPTRGAIYIDDVPLDDRNRRLWRRSVAFVPQEPFLFNDTIAANLGIAQPKANEEQMWAALERASFASHVRGLPDGLATVVGDRGARFSGGERQRIALARALMRHPELLILDEATSALDWENQAIIASAIEKLRGTMTIVVIAHRPSVIQMADDVLALEAGRLVEAGAYATLAQNEHSRLSAMLRNEHA